jgi:hypothetical protein
MAKTYSPAELKVLRRRDRYTLQTREKLIQDVCALAALLFKNHPSVTKQPKVPEIVICSFSLCTLYLCIDT